MSDGRPSVRPITRGRTALPAVLVVVLSLVSFLLFHLTFKSLLSGQPEPLPESVARLPVVGWLLEKLSVRSLLHQSAIRQYEERYGI